MGNNCKGICVSGAETLGEGTQPEESARAQIVKHPVQIATEHRKNNGNPMGPHSSHQGTAQNTMAISSAAESSKKISFLEDGVAFLIKLECSHRV